MNFSPDFNKLDAIPKKENFEKNFEFIIKLIDKELGGLTPIRKERARKVFNECVEKGLRPETVENSQQIIGIIKEDLQTFEPTSEGKIIDNNRKPEDRRETSSIGRLFGR